MDISEVLARPDGKEVRTNVALSKVWQALRKAGNRQRSIDAAGTTESLSRSSRDRSNTNLNPSDPRIGQNPRDVGGSIERSDRNSVINRGRW